MVRGGSRLWRWLGAVTGAISPRLTALSILGGGPQVSMVSRSEWVTLGPRGVGLGPLVHRDTVLDAELRSG
jgi:hypothetical protein